MYLGLAASCSTSRQVLVVAGDGGFQMSSNELSTLRDHNCKNVLVVIIQNGRLGRVSNETWGPGVRADGCLIGSPDFVKLVGQLCALHISISKIHSHYHQ
jgi:thiamine pyrophosphate-dependent acetolactate synthase large subunit-like protein